MRKPEFGVGEVTVGIMLLTHENRLKNLDDLWIDCGSRAHERSRSYPRPGPSCYA